MLESNKAQKVLDFAMGAGASFADIYVEKNRLLDLKTLKGKVDKVSSGIDFGVGIRLVFGTKVLYGYTNSVELDELMRVTGLLAAMDRTSPHNHNYDARRNPVSLNKILLTENHPATLGLKDDVPMRDKLAFMLAVETATREVHDKIIQTSVSCLQRLQEISIFNSEGLEVNDTRNYVRLFANCVAADGGEQATGYEAPGALQGWEFTHSIDAKELGERVGKQAMTMLSASYCPPGEMPVVISHGFGGVIFHEACGHLLETTAVEKKASVFHDKMGEMIASPVVSAFDDGTIGNNWGSSNIDDEGMPTQKTTLIGEGRLESFMVDRVGALKTGFRPTGSGRRQNYRFAPASRMRNTYIGAGKDRAEDIIASVEYGIFAKNMGGGSVMPGTGEFNFAVNEGYLIQKGKITTPVKGVTLIGKGPEILKRISMVGSDLKMAAGMCGSISGAIPASVGQPTLKVDRILVGGKS